MQDRISILYLKHNDQVCHRFFYEKTQIAIASIAGCVIITMPFYGDSS